MSENNKFCDKGTAAFIVAGTVFVVGLLLGWGAIEFFDQNKRIGVIIGLAFIFGGAFLSAKIHENISEE